MNWKLKPNITKYQHDVFNHGKYKLTKIINKIKRNVTGNIASNSGLEQLQE